MSDQDMLGLGGQEKLKDTDPEPQALLCELHEARRGPGSVCPVCTTAQGARQLQAQLDVAERRPTWEHYAAVQERLTEKSAQVDTLQLEIARLQDQGRTGWPEVITLLDQLKRAEAMARVVDIALSHLEQLGQGPTHPTSYIIEELRWALATFRERT